MKLVYKTMQSHIEISSAYVSSLIIESPTYYYEMIKNLKLQVNGEDGNWVLSDNDVPIAINKNIELIIDCIEFEINKRNVLSKVLKELEKVAVDTEHLDETLQLISLIEKYILKLTEDYDVEIQCDKITIQQLLKSVGITINICSESLTEILYSYMQLIRDFVDDRVFVFVNLRSFVAKDELQLFIDTAIGHGFKILIFENKDYPMLNGERRIIIDEDLCEI